MIHDQPVLPMDGHGRAAVIRSIVESHSRQELERILLTCPADVGALIRVRLARQAAQSPRAPMRSVYASQAFLGRTRSVASSAPKRDEDHNA